MEKRDIPQIGERFFISPKVERRDNADNTSTFIISTAAQDRHGTEIMPDGIDLTAFRTNPIVLFNHDYNRVIGRVVGQLEIRGGKLLAQVEYDDDDEFARSIKSKVKRGFMNAASIGFMVRDADYDEERDVVNITRSELLEFSIVSVPSNREALVMTRGMDAQPEIQGLREEIAALRTLIENKADQKSAVTDAAEAVSDAEPEAAPERDAEDDANESAAAELPAKEPARQALPKTRQATPLDYAKVAEALIPTIRTTVRRSLGRE